MNYYNPNYYMNYPYNTQYPIPGPQVSQPPLPQSLNGKIVDSADVVRATEVPIGGYGIFPKADLSEIYIKSWNNNGTTSVITFVPMVPEATPTADLTTILLQKIETLETKLDSILTPIDKTKKAEVPKSGF